MIRSRRDPLRVVLVRRAWTIPFIVVFFVVVTATLPLLTLGALAGDIVRRARRGTPFVLVRGVLFGWVYLAVEVWALTSLLFTWVFSAFGLWRRAELALTYRLQLAWARMLFGALRAIFGLALEVENDDVVAPGPVVVMVRHASMIDTLLPNNLVTRRRGILLRYVLKNELLYDPALDVAGHRLVNHFVERSGDSEAQVENVRRLSEGLTGDEGVLIYPEGTRFTEEKRERVLARLREIDPARAERAEALRHTLPPRLGGPLALLDPLTPCDVVFMAHVGLDGMATVKRLLSGKVVGSRIRVRFWRVPREEIPEGREARIDWLFGQWERVDAWIGSHAAP
ncbi:MAG: lysophospholipid acyltransferase family protein [Actinobacteria bacterium]|nr:lysophospholipid acyltransferase family protein [Actinomycetota bacterium]